MPMRAVRRLREFLRLSDAWGVTGASLDRLIDEQRLLPDEIAADTSEMTSMLQRMRHIGRRTAELHHALASHDVDGFTPEPILAEDSVRWSEAIATRAARVFEMLRTNADRMDEPAAALTQRLLGQGEAIFAHIESLKDARFAGSKIRHHGDFHLGQILIAKDDAYILDFEGEPRHSLEQRRSKAPPTRDIAGFLRSVDYAAIEANLARNGVLISNAAAAFVGAPHLHGFRIAYAYLSEADMYRALTILADALRVLR